MKAIRYIIFIPIIFLVIGTVYSLLPLSLFYLMSLSKFWLIFLLLAFGGLIIGSFQLLPGGISWISAKISPSKTFAYYTIFITSLLFAIAWIYHYWATPEEDVIEYGLFIKIMLTFLTVGFAISISIGAGFETFTEKSNSFSIMLSIGAIFFYIGIFLVFSLLSTKICYINPDKTYSWYSGIWHGIFVLPHWVISWFSNEIYCKAPNSSTAYTIWWWISFIFVGLSIFGGSNKRERQY